MKKVKPTKTWSFSLIICGLCSLIIVITTIIGIELSDGLKCILAIVMLITVPIMMYTSYKMLKEVEK